MKSTVFVPHDHQNCIESAMQKVKTICEEKKLQLTPVRERVLELLWAEHRAMGAYEILESLQAEGHKAQPPVAYRALDFLVTHGFAHRIERLNAFIACNDPGVHHQAAFLICRECDAVAETEVARHTLDDAAKKSGFAVEGAVVEAEGLCPRCQSQA